MLRRSFLPIAVLGLLLLLVGMSRGLANSNSVPGASAGEATVFIDPNTLKPEACNGIDVDDLISGSGDIVGTNGNDLILGSSGADVISGGGGDDCIVGGSGLDAIDGGGGDDACSALSPDALIDDCETSNP